MDARQLRRPVRRPDDHPPEGNLVVWSLRHLPDEVRTVGTMLSLDAIWRQVDLPTSGRTADRTLVMVDEAWLLMRDGEGAKFVLRMAKEAMGGLVSSPKRGCRR